MFNIQEKGNEWGKINDTVELIKNRHKNERIASVYYHTNALTPSSMNLMAKTSQRLNRYLPEL